MKILYIGDVMGEAGIATVEKVLPAICSSHQIDLVIAQAENVSDGKGLALSDYERLKRAGVQAFSGGNWTMHKDETHILLDDENAPVTRPANYPDGTVGKRYKIVESTQGRVLMVSLLGSIVGKDADKPTDNPLSTIDEILNSLSKDEFTAVIVNFHGDFSSEKVVIGYYLDGRATAVIGDHWHVPTADARVLKNGTAHITDVGMCGSLESSLGVKLESVIPRWRDDIQTRNILETEGTMQFNAVLVETDQDTKRAKSIIQIRKII
jgi:metallophosphoesterase (TIGR00282 family)